MERKLTRFEKYAFGFGTVGKDAIFNIVSLFLMFYITDIVGLSPAFVGVLFFAARIWDAINDPIMGMVVDNTHNRFGKFKTWLVVGTLINAVITILLFTNFNLPGNGMYIYISVIYIIWGMTYTIMDIPYWSWLPNLTNNPREREEVAVVPRFFASFAAFVIGSFGLLFIHQLDNWLGHSFKGAGIFALAIICSITFLITIGITVFYVHEDTEIERQNAIKVQFKDLWRILFKNKELLAIIGVILAFNLCGQMINGIILYYFKYVAGVESLFSVFNTMILMEMVSLLIFPFLVKKVGRSAVFNFAVSGIVIGLVIILVAGFIAPHSALWVVIGGACIRFGTGTLVGINTVALADVIDYSEVKFGQRNESVITSTQTFLVKLAQAFAGLSVGIGLSFIGYTPNVAQTAETVWGIRIGMIGIPIFFIIICSLLYHKAFNLKGDFLKDIEKTLEYKRKREGHSPIHHETPQTEGVSSAMNS
ncbi:melibiose:sodium transporter MelB [Staphylococcus carnosus]|uniref:Lactose permease n=1 Tax=Staphylococcus carnosus (strain TM300) TaxID=396513 RepID=B9DL34_STACT|nr:melibiose:sodium transporter MelB [Staphylococcus carnosus]QPT04947.1 melibiose:sodium transporter MelB [Staphylococcus carnosus]UQA67672.1 melibiose:sodium transporter MelB [Staphylococcus carnosus]UTB77500.1 melibiose:sodium symporter [Staphylococcus carnosus]UTB87044.1 melibiose:sodium symporter [Staphylococcus carnosus]UTB89394.1 melibiose:sodium symporter [Staphylococcus carnosus]